MEEKSECEHCRTWEEQMYWKHFSSMHFFLFLSKDFHDHLMLPAKFAVNMTAKLPTKVALVGPSGSVWDVELLKTGDLGFVGDGWKGFVKAYDLEENCLLLFKYKQSSTFEVLIFDPKSLCEKESTYFVKACMLKQPGQKKNTKRSINEASSTDTMEDDDGFAFVASKKARNSAVQEVVCAGQRNKPQGPRKSLPDTAVEDHHDNTEFVVSSKSKEGNVNVVHSGQRSNPQGSRKSLSSSRVHYDHEFVVSSKSRDSIEDVVPLGQRNNPQGPRKCPPDTAAQDGHDDPEFLISKKSRKVVVEEVVSIQRNTARDPRKCPTESAAEDDRDDPEFVASSKSRKGAIEEVVSMRQMNSLQDPRKCPPPDAGADDGHDEPELIVYSKFKNGAVEEVVSRQQRNSPQDPRKCPPDAGAEDDEPELILYSKSRKDAGEKVIADPQISRECPTEPASEDDPDDPEFVVSAARGGGRPGSAVVLHRSPGKLNAQSERKPSGNSTVKEFSQISGRGEMPKGNGNRQPITPDNGESSPVKNHSHKFSRKRGRPVKRALPTSARKLAFKSVSAEKRFVREYLSCRRPVTESEIEDALRRAKEGLTEKSCFVVMRPTSVYKRFYLNIPAEWMHKHLPRRHQQVILRVGEKSWLAMYTYYNQRAATGGLSGGWKKFAIDNFLEEFDVCIFKLVSQKDDAAVVLDVDIFRVVQEIVPPIPMNSSLI